jgi:predicted SAM-dependent methyltransferase
MPHKLDIGCGPNKRPGYIGIDTRSCPGVDHVIDIEQERLPFPDASVSHVFSSHCLEHLKDPMQLFREIARVAQDGAEVEIWTPYAFSNGAFMYSHLHFLAEDHYSHMCILFPEVYKNLTGAYWNWHDLTYVVSVHTAVEINRASVPIDFALKYYKNVCLEFGIRMTVQKNSWSRVDPVRYVCLERNGVRYKLPPVPPIGEAEIEAYVQQLGSMSRTAE